MNWAKRKEAEAIERKKLGGVAVVVAGTVGKAEDDSILKKLIVKTQRSSVGRATDCRSL